MAYNITFSIIYSQVLYHLLRDNIAKRMVYTMRFALQFVKGVHAV